MGTSGTMEVGDSVDLTAGTHYIISPTPEGNVTIYRILRVSMGLGWSAGYVLIIARARRDRTYGMPIVALATNLSWELLYSFVFRSPHKAGRIFHTTWLLLDIGILAQAVRYGPVEHNVSPARFSSQLGLSLVASSAIIGWYATRGSDPMGIYSALSSNVVMSALFLKMLSERGSSRGQSVGIALSKMLGTASSTAALLLFPRPPYDKRTTVVPLGAAILGLDGAYLMRLMRVIRRERSARALVPFRTKRPRRSKVAGRVATPGSVLSVS